MKKLNLFFTTMFFVLMFSVSATAQEKNFFNGKWNVNVVGTPGGDSKMILNIVDNEGKVSGSLIDPATNKDLFPLTKVELEGKDKMTVYFTSEGYDVYLFLEKKDQDNAEGSMMEMFDATAVRMK
ncbi:hypothetical protein NLG42_19745 [Flavobacterium plurextorum]|uniref:hypothetical protein n=1 Tax=Flavobacterium TaxID=237 RepID=UPI00214D2BB0|nr:MULTISPECIES: hypothetical protein [Flavobacterium]UUW08329.1 hypothetical protein NLG42_19745 [Flavobacterium plurextorum]